MYEALALPLAQKQAKLAIAALNHVKSMGYANLESRPLIAALQQEVLSSP